jgi:signal transduction histidine kinase
MSTHARTGQRLNGWFAALFEFGKPDDAARDAARDRDALDPAHDDYDPWGPRAVLATESTRMLEDAPEITVVSLPTRSYELAIESERRRLAREVHDGVLQSLTAVALQLEALSAFIEHNPERARERLQRLGEMLCDEQQELRKWLESLAGARPATTSTGDLVPLLHKLCRRLEFQWGYRAELNVSARMEIPARLIEHVYRLLQEGLNNVGRHAKATCVRVEVRVQGASLRLLIADNGRGFPFHGSYGLASLRARRVGPQSLMERLSWLGGDLVVDSLPSGARIEITWPLPAGEFRPSSQASAEAATPGARSA